MSEPAIFPTGTILSSEVPASPTVPVRGGRGRGVLVVVLVLVNAAAIWGQAGWALDHIVPAGWTWWAGLTLSLAFAAALELIGVFLAVKADEGEERGLASGGIRLGSYGVGLMSGALNFSHWGLFTAAACAFAFLSTVSPFLWGINSRVRRGRPVAPSRRFWHPIRSVHLIRHMAWHGIVDESDGIRDMEFRTAPEVVPVSPAPSTMTKLDWGRAAMEMRGEHPEWSWETISKELGISASYLFQCRRELRKTGEPQ